MIFSISPHFLHAVNTSQNSALLCYLILCREFGRWKVNNLAVERRDFLESPLPLTPEFIRNIRLLGRRPTTQMITDNLIRKYGTHFLLSATLGGKQKSKQTYANNGFLNCFGMKFVNCSVKTSKSFGLNWIKMRKQGL